ncbi:hypothetical protein [Stackebrandtia soli]|uniref:hypothetical protein n=1 Tax=Stackebrandtia soli TaxID=1892856 RepID=UPI0039E92D74
METPDNAPAKALDPASSDMATPEGMTLSTTPTSLLSTTEIAEVAAWIADRNADASAHVGYLSTRADEVSAEIANMEKGSVIAHCVRHADRVGLMIAEWDPVSTRAWLHGPWTADDAIADGLFAALAPHIPARNTEHEVFCDERNATVTGFARRHGMVLAGAFDTRSIGREVETPEPENVILPAEPHHLASFARIHRLTHPEAHRSAEQIVADDVPLLVALAGETVLGYGTRVVIPGSSTGLIEHIGVDPDLPDERRSQVRDDLLASSVRLLFANHDISHVEIVARPERAAEFERLGFRLLRSMRAYRSVVESG